MCVCVYIYVYIFYILHIIMYNYIYVYNMYIFYSILIHILFSNHFQITLDTQLPIQDPTANNFQNLINLKIWKFGKYYKQVNSF